MTDQVLPRNRITGGMGEPPVLVGHSMGGMVVQKYMHARPLPAAVLMASVPPHGMAGSALGMVFSDPMLYRELTLVQTVGWRAPVGDPFGSLRIIPIPQTPEVPLAHPQHLRRLDAIQFPTAIPPDRLDNPRHPNLL